MDIFQGLCFDLDPFTEGPAGEVLFPEASFGVEPFEVRSFDEVPAGDLLFGRVLFGDAAFSAAVPCFSTLSSPTDFLAVVCWSKTKWEF